MEDLRYKLVMDVCQLANVEHAGYFKGRMCTHRPDKPDSAELHIVMRHPVNEIDVDGFFSFVPNSDLPENIRGFILKTCQEQGVL